MSREEDRGAGTLGGPEVTAVPTSSSVIRTLLGTESSRGVEMIGVEKIGVDEITIRGVSLVFPESGTGGSVT